MTHHKINALHKHSLGPGFPKPDIEEGALNDDQLQALWGRTLEEAQNEEFVEIVAAWLDAPRKTVTIDAAKTLYEALRTHDAIMVSEPDEDGLLEE